MCCCIRCADAGPRGDEGAWQIGTLGTGEACLGMERQVPWSPSLPVIQAEVPFPNVALFIVFRFLESYFFRHVNFLTPGVSSTLDYKCLEAGDLGFCGLQIATPRQLVSAYEQKLCGPA